MWVVMSARDGVSLDENGSEIRPLCSETDGLPVCFDLRPMVTSRRRWFRTNAWNGGLVGSEGRANVSSAQPSNRARATAVRLILPFWGEIHRCFKQDSSLPLLRSCRGAVRGLHHPTREAFVVAAP
jgi:hypothetical protein